MFDFTGVTRARSEFIALKWELVRAKKECERTKKESEEVKKRIADGETFALPRWNL
jgi:hypothetical protein